ncbi:CinA family protein [Corynebacterium lemuris]
MNDPSRQAAAAANAAAEKMAEAIAALALEHGFTVATAESLTGGQVATTLAAAEDSSEWFAGSVVSYQTRIKYEVLGVPEGQPVITEEAVTAMAVGVAELMGADATVALSGCGGPGKQEGQEPGTTWIAAHVRGTTRAELHHYTGEPEEVLAQSRQRALELLQALMQATVTDQST